MFYWVGSFLEWGCGWCLGFKELKYMWCWCGFCCYCNEWVLVVYFGELGIEIFVEGNLGSWFVLLYCNINWL